MAKLATSQLWPTSLPHVRITGPRHYSDEMVIASSITYNSTVVQQLAQATKSHKLPYYWTLCVGNHRRIPSQSASNAESALPAEQLDTSPNQALPLQTTCQVWLVWLQRMVALSSSRVNQASFGGTGSGHPIAGIRESINNCMNGRMKEGMCDGTAQGLNEWKVANGCQKNYVCLSEPVEKW